MGKISNCNEISALMKVFALRTPNLSRVKEETFQSELTEVGSGRRRAWQGFLTGPTSVRGEKSNINVRVKHYCERRKGGNEHLFRKKSIKKLVVYAKGELSN